MRLTGNGGMPMSPLLDAAPRSLALLPHRSIGCSALSNRSGPATNRNTHRVTHIQGIKRASNDMNPHNAPTLLPKIKSSISPCSAKRLISHFSHLPLQRSHSQRRARPPNLARSASAALARSIQLHQSQQLWNAQLL